MSERVPNPFDLSLLTPASKQELIVLQAHFRKAEGERWLRTKDPALRTLRALAEHLRPFDRQMGYDPESSVPADFLTGTCTGAGVALILLEEHDIRPRAGMFDGDVHLAVTAPVDTDEHHQRHLIAQEILLRCSDIRARDTALAQTLEHYDPGPTLGVRAYGHFQDAFAFGFDAVRQASATFLERNGYSATSEEILTGIDPVSSTLPPLTSGEVDNACITELLGDISSFLKDS